MAENRLQKSLDEQRAIREHLEKQKKLPKTERLGKKWAITDEELAAEGIAPEEWDEWRRLAGTPSVRQGNKVMDNTIGTLKDNKFAGSEEKPVSMPGRVRRIIRRR